MNTEQMYEELYQSPEVQAVVAHEFNDWVEAMEVASMMAQPDGEERIVLENC